VRVVDDFIMGVQEMNKDDQQKNIAMFVLDLFCWVGIFIWLGYILK